MLASPLQLIAHQTLLSNHGGIFILNFASRDNTNETRYNCLQTLTLHFNHLSSLKLDDDINEIIFASKHSLLNENINTKILKQNLKNLQNYV